MVEFVGTGCVPSDKPCVRATSVSPPAPGARPRTTRPQIMHLANHELPFGGVGPSGMGSYHGHRSFLAFTHEKAVLEKSPLLDQSLLLKPLLAARFPPYTPLKQKLVALFSMRFAEIAVNVHRHTSFWLLLLAYAGYAAGMRVTFV